MNGEKLQWLVIADTEQFAITEPMTTDQVKLRWHGRWYRPLIRYEQDGQMEVRDTAVWPEISRKIEEMRERNGKHIEECR